jgi:tetratricopeptide (TPR) repeat protein
MRNGERSNNEVAVAVSGSFRMLSVASALCLAVAVGGAQEALGKISFPNTGSPAAQAPFIRGMLLYHSFEYDRASAAFIEAQRIDPTFAMAFVGEALTHTHQVWNQQNMAAGRAALAKFAPTTTQRITSAKSARERMYIELVEHLYGEGPKARRDTLFTNAAAALAAAYPDDDEAKILHAVGLLGLNQGTRDFTTYMKAGALAEEVLRRNPEHPGAAHFVIHAFDDPVHAPLGLWAARAYMKIAAGAPHAVHMTSHIFVALGMWDDVIEQNIVASGHDHGAYVPGHYTWWLSYGYGQAGRFDDARKHLQTTKANWDKKMPRASGSALQMMRAHYIIDGERWSDPIAKWDLSSAPASGYGSPGDLFFRGYVALKNGDMPAAAQAAAALMNGAKVAVGTPIDAGGAWGILGKELRGAIASAQGRHADAIPLLTEAAKDEDNTPFEFGPPMIPKPTTEMLGEALLAAGKPAEAVGAFRRSLARTPGRNLSLLGLARAATANGDKATAAAALAQLKANWHRADKDLSHLAEVTRLAAGAK